MNAYRTLFVLAPAALAMAALGADAPAAAAEFYYASTTATQSYSTFIGPIPITGLSLTLPAASSHFNAAMVTLNMPNLFLSDNTSTTTPMAAQLSIVAPFSPAGVLIAGGGIGCDNVNVKTSGLKPLTIVLLVPLGANSQPVEGEWNSNGSSTVTTSTFASLSAILVKQ
ncbi:MAG TPA: hypothetical protein VMI94_25570 [Bryobacteraceae bacterium]|nr:hypothetical protein [Bryobacteraceae bacterium]